MDYLSALNYHKHPINKVVYVAKDLELILSCSPSKISYLLAEKPFPIVIANRRKFIPIHPFHEWLRTTYPNIIVPPIQDNSHMISKNTLTVPEIRALLGIGKTSSYAFIKTGILECLTYNGNIRVTKASFNAWLHSEDQNYKFNYIKKKEIKNGSYL